MTRKKPQTFGESSQKIRSDVPVLVSSLISGKDVCLLKWTGYSLEFVAGSDISASDKKTLEKELPTAQSGKIGELRWCRYLGGPPIQTLAKYLKLS